MKVILQNFEKRFPIIHTKKDWYGYPNRLTLHYYLVECHNLFHKNNFLGACFSPHDFITLASAIIMLKESGAIWQRITAPDCRYVSALGGIAPENQITERREGAQRAPRLSDTGQNWKTARGASVRYAPHYRRMNGMRLLRRRWRHQHRIFFPGSNRAGLNNSSIDCNSPLEPAIEATRCSPFVLTDADGVGDRGLPATDAAGMQDAIEDAATVNAPAGRILYFKKGPGRAGRGRC